jgi:hypothetical protein
VFSDFSLEDLVFLVSDVGLVIEGLSVLVNVSLKLSQGVGQSISGGEKDIVDHIVSIEDVSVSIFDLLSESSDILVVVIGSSVELMNKFIKFAFEVSDEFLD